MMQALQLRAYGLALQANYTQALQAYEQYAGLRRCGQQGQQPHNTDSGSIVFHGYNHALLHARLNFPHHMQ